MGFRAIPVDLTAILLFVELLGRHVKLSARPRHGSHLVGDLGFGSGLRTEDRREFGIRGQTWAFFGIEDREFAWNPHTESPHVLEE